MNAKVGIITGASSGLGLELSTRLVTEDYFIVGVSRKTPTDQRWLEWVKQNRCVHVAGDISREDTVMEAFAKANHFGRLDLLINCAGEGVFGPVGSISRQDIDDVLSGNLVGTILFSQAALTQFRTSGGLIVNIMSTASLIGRSNEAIYCAAKWGARGYTESLRIEAKGTNAKVIAIYPGGMNTPFWTKAKGAHVDPHKFISPAVVADMILNSLTMHDGGYISDITINRS